MRDIYSLNGNVCKLSLFFVLFLATMDDSNHPGGQNNLKYTNFKVFRVEFVDRSKPYRSMEESMQENGLLQ